MTAASNEALARVRDEVAVATFPDGGLLLHVASGDIFQLDAAAAAVWRAIADARGIADAVAALQSSLRLSPDEARLSIEAMIESALSIARTAPAETYRIDDGAASMALCKGQRPLLVFDRRMRTLALGDPMAAAGEADGNDADVAALVRLFIPKVLSLWFPLAMHASALEIDDGALLFSGASGAGKTTTARTLAEMLPGPGGRLLSEDIVLLSSVGDTNTVVGSAEPLVRSWIDDTARTLLDDPRATPAVEDLARALAGQRDVIPLRKIVFLNAARRRGDAWSLRALGPAETLGALFLNSFVPSVAAPALRSHLDACRSVASGARGWEATTIPAGLAELSRSSRAQSEMIAS